MKIKITENQMEEIEGLKPSYPYTLYNYKDKNRI